MAPQADVQKSGPTPAPKSSLFGWGVVGLVVGLIVVVGGIWWLRSPDKTAHAAVSPAERSADPSAEDEAVRVEVVHPTPGGITRTSTQVGSVHPYQFADLYAKASGYLKTLKVDIGDKVKNGELLAEIDDPELVKEEELTAAEVRQAKSAVKAIEAAVKSFEAAAQSAHARVEQAKADIQRYASTRRFREKELARYQGLYKQQAVPRSVIDEEEEHLESAWAAEKSATAAVQTATADAIAADANVVKAKADLDEATSKVEVAEAKHEKLQVLVGYLKITSPYSGVITVRNVHPGYFVRSAAEGVEKPLLRVSRTDIMRVVTYVPDRDVPYVDVGDPAEVSLDALDSTSEGKVSRFAEFEDPASRTMRTEIDLKNPDGKIKEGMYGTATIVLDKTRAALTIPTGCLAGESKNGKGKVFVVRDGKAKATEINVGADDGIRLEVLKGLTPDDLVIVNSSAVSDGTPVVISTPSKSGNMSDGAGRERK